MWYVIQTMVGNENNIREQIGKLISRDLYKECFSIKYENIWKKSGSSNICVEALFQGYLFIETDNPEQLYMGLKGVEGFSSMLTDKDDKEITFLKVEKDEQELLESLINGDPEHIVRVSYVHRNKQKRIDYAKGPLKNYVDKIVSVDYHHRRAFIEIPFLNGVRRIKLAIIADEDIVKEKELRITSKGDTNNYEKPSIHKSNENDMEDINIDKKDNTELPDIDKWDWKARKAYNDSQKVKESEEETVMGIKAGDWICDDSSTYVDQFMKVKRVIPNKNCLIVEVKMFGTVVELELEAEKVHRVEVRG